MEDVCESEGGFSNPVDARSSPLALSHRLNGRIWTPTRGATGTMFFTKSPKNRKKTPEGTSASPMEEPERERVSRTDGKALAEAWVAAPRGLAIADTLLNSQDIQKVVEETGAVSPFFVGGGRKSRLKKAAYEGRIGSRAYIFRDVNIPVRIFDDSKDDALLVPKNSIVFVESDLDFRIPDFVALRFNLQIQHVHRGLLLGTGPLVDPGFWGKLCIPLHNLTDQDYEIPKNEGLIWLEFTKTTLATNIRDDARAPLVGTPSDENGHWDIEKFLNKAATQYTGIKIPIRSSLPTMFEEANLATIKSAADAKSALAEAEKLKSMNFIAMVAAAVGLGALTISAAVFLSNLLNRNEDLAVRLQASTDTAQRSIDGHIDDVARFETAPAEKVLLVPALRAQVERQRREIAVLRENLVRTKADIEEIKRFQAAESLRNVK